MQNQNIQYLKSRIEKLESLKGLKLNYIDDSRFPHLSDGCIQLFLTKEGTLTNLLEDADLTADNFDPRIQNTEHYCLNNLKYWFIENEIDEINKNILELS